MRGSDTIWHSAATTSLARAEGDLDFASKVLPIVPAIFVSSDYDCVRALKRGNKKLKHRLAAARWLVMPHFRDEKLKPLQVEEDGEFIIPTLNKMTLVAMEELGWTGKAESVPTFKSKIWAPSRPVVHAAAAYVLACYHRGPHISYRATSRWLFLHGLLGASFDDSSAYTEV